MPVFGWGRRPAARGLARPTVVGQDPEWDEVLDGLSHTSPRAGDDAVVSDLRVRLGDALFALSDVLKRLGEMKGHCARLEEELSAQQAKRR